MITPFGIATRKLRLDKGLRLLDLAERVKLSSSFVSAVETGKKPIPPNYVAAVVRALDLNAIEASHLQKAADQSRGMVDVEALGGSQRELVAAFARRLDDLPPEFLDQIKKKVFKSTAGEIPFKRKRRGLLVAPLSVRAIWNFANQIRDVFVDKDDVHFPIMDILEFRLSKFIGDFYVDPCSHEEMGSEEGRVVAGQDCIKLREDVYEGAWKGVGRHRFTACHELAHYLIHRNVTLARSREDSHPIYRDAEWQADTFAGSLMMSSRHLDLFENQDIAAARCGMTPLAAGVMWAKYKKEGCF